MLGCVGLPSDAVPSGDYVVLVDEGPATATRPDLDVGLGGTGRSGEGDGEGKGSAKNKLRRIWWCSKVQEVKFCHSKV